MSRPASIVVLGLIGGLLATADSLLSQETGESKEEQRQGTLQVAQAAPPALPPSEENLISLDFKEAEIQTVLQALARKAKVNIVSAKSVTGLVTIYLENVSWEQALNTIVKTYGFGYEKEENVILVSTMEELKARREAMKGLVEIEPVVTKVIQLKYLDAADVSAFLEPQLTAQGKISVLEMTGQKGWSFGAGQAAGGGGAAKVAERVKRERARSKAVVITDTPTTLDRLEKILTKIDVLPKQILIEARVMEVDRDLLRDINLKLATGATAGSTTLSTRTTPASKDNAGRAVKEFALGESVSDFTPSIFIPATTGLTPAAAGSQIFFSTLFGTQFSALLNLLEEDVRTNTLSSPHILTISGQEAKILVGTKYPILETQVSGTSSTVTTTTLSYYQDIGIELFVVPQVSGDRHIDMIVHPVISSRTGTVGTNAYPILDVRETETQIVLENGETIMIGGLLKDVKSKSRIGIPFLGKLPLIGPLFSRSTTDVQKIDLLIFLTAKVVEPATLSPEETERLRLQYEEFFRAEFQGKPAHKDSPLPSPGPEGAVEPKAPQKSSD